MIEEKIMQGAVFPSQVQTVSAMIRPQDIPVLELLDLEGLEATGRLTYSLKA